MARSEACRLNKNKRNNIEGRHRNYILNDRNTSSHFSKKILLSFTSEEIQLENRSYDPSWENYVDKETRCFMKVLRFIKIVMDSDLITFIT